MNDQQQKLKDMLTEIIKDPVDFAKNAQELPPQIVQQLHTLLLTTLIITMKQQGGIIDQIVGTISANGTLQPEETPEG